MSVDTFHYPDQCQLFCPRCQVDLTLAKHEHGAVRPPRGGDHTVCFECLSFLCYVEPEPGQLRLDLLTLEAFSALPEQNQASLLQVKGELQRAKAEGGQVRPTRYEAALALELTALKARVAALEAEAEQDRACPTCKLVDCCCDDDAADGEGEDT